MRNSLLTIGIVLSLVACIVDPAFEEGSDAGADDKHIVTTPKGLATSPEAISDPGEDIVAPCPPDMPPSYCDPEGGEGGGTGGGTGGGGGGGGGSSGGDPLPCLGSGNSWCQTHQRCERNARCEPPTPDFVCFDINHDAGRYSCECFYYPPYNP